MYRIAIYGKGGIGKSTTVSNLAAALAAEGKTVLQIGCDPKADSTIAHTRGRRIPSVLEVLRTKPASDVKLEDIVTRAENGVWCSEAGGPTPGTGCAGRGIVAAFESLSAVKAFETIRPDVVFYDVLGDVVCGGFAMPIRKGYAENVFIVTSGENMAIYAAGNIAALVVDSAVADALIKSNPELALAAFEFDPNEVNYGKAAVIAKGNEDFVAAVNEVITKVASDGSFQKAYDEAVALADSMGLEMD